MRTVTPATGRRTNGLAGTLMDIARAGAPCGLERRLVGLAEEMLRGRASAASAPAFHEQRAVWADLDRAYHRIMKALDRVRRAETGRA